MAKAALRRAREAPASTKARILEAAEEVFATKGFEGASTREIAAKAGVNISSLHYHWDTKETLYFAVFQNIYNQLIEISRDSVLPATARGDSPRVVHEASVGRVFDYFAENPNIPRLLLRRILENEEFGDAIERDILLPSWKEFGGWVRQYSGRKIHDIDAQLLILTLHSTLLLFTLDSRAYAHILGGSISDPEVVRRVRGHLIQLSALLISAHPRA
ncbi:MAG: TetR/AcrR family transcriptional regulator [Deltaproteobacteria bacterium]|nr:TetR/AcrR family transcriptional regulator [Deltaproteobacteria bacterium]